MVIKLASYRKIEIIVLKDDIDESLHKIGLKATQKNRSRFMEEMEEEIEGLGIDEILEWTEDRMKNLFKYKDERKELDEREDVEVCPNCLEVVDKLIDDECCDNCERYYRSG